MIRLFPHQTAYLERTRLRYVNLTNILNDGKITREGRLTGLVVLFFGEELGWIFQVRGEPTTAARVRPERREIVPLSWALKRAEQELERADVAYFGVSPEQLLAMYATLAGEPTLQLPSDTMSRPGQLLGDLRERRFDGVVELLDGIAAHYLVLADGALEDAFIAGRGETEAVEGALERALFAPYRGPVRGAGYARVDALPIQAPRALGELYGRVIEDAIAEVGRTMGDEPATACFANALERLKPGCPALQALGVGADGTVLGDAVASAEDLTAGVAAWLFEGLSAASHASDIDALEVYPRVIQPHYHALQAQGFLKRLPWPAAI